MDLVWPSEGPFQGAFLVLYGESWASVYGWGMECGSLRIAQGLGENVGHEHHPSSGLSLPPLGGTGMYPLLDEARVRELKFNHLSEPSSPYL